MWTGVNTSTKLNIFIMFNSIKKKKRQLTDARNGNFTRVGFPVRVMTKTKDGWRFSAGQISRVYGAEIDIWVFPSTGETPYILKSARHQQFKKKGLPWWSFPVSDYCYAEEHTDF
jgi:hypothetical protein